MSSSPSPRLLLNYSPHTTSSMRSPPHPRPSSSSSSPPFLLHHSLRLKWLLKQFLKTKQSRLKQYRSIQNGVVLKH
ncbi:hypothetical protein QVD17_38363 [Tagetes erecta]|uniref:Uncharacterized protein n=1 Tax=Tagetes erecta TaxID=13708 RepID=A0AAD8N9A6_TARER|nr:hypothetical protein QVD17_38363 [Tagetes erecta]